MGGAKKKLSKLLSCSSEQHISIGWLLPFLQPISDRILVERQGHAGVALSSPSLGTQSKPPMAPPCQGTVCNSTKNKAKWGCGAEPPRALCCTVTCGLCERGLADTAVQLQCVRCCPHCWHCALGSDPCGKQFAWTLDSDGVTRSVAAWAGTKCSCGAGGTTVHVVEITPLPKESRVLASKKKWML